ncbi:MAG: heme exporter protein A [Candidatus Endobugula sp.]|jgi:heme exporter protein A
MVIKSSNSTSLLAFRQVACHRDNRMLFSGVDYTIHSGDIVQITGANGIGKTTLLRAIIGLLHDYDGEICWRDQPLDGQGVNKGVANKRYDFTSELLFIGHLAGVKQSLTPRENLQFLANLHGAKTYNEEQIDHALAQVGLYGYENMPGYQLSAGQNRRIALARLYINQATIWVLDEPYTALDAQVIEKLETLFIQHAEQGGCVVFTSHQAPAIKTLRILSLSDYAGAYSKRDVEDDVNENVDDHGEGGLDE